MGVGRDNGKPIAMILTHLFRFINSHQSFHACSSVKGTLNLALLYVANSGGHATSSLEGTGYTTTGTSRGFCPIFNILRLYSVGGKSCLGAVGAEFEIMIC
uniref:SFRICE_027437 n=1 Tax=Spodoptera frugiperda TaxID=7108 RepID=A0A2H1VC01_SPOFR